MKKEDPSLGVKKKGLSLKLNPRNAENKWSYDPTPPTSLYNVYMDIFTISSCIWLEEFSSSS